MFGRLLVDRGILVDFQDRNNQRRGETLFSDSREQWMCFLVNNDWKVIISQNHLKILLIFSR